MKSKNDELSHLQMLGLLILSMPISGFLGFLGHWWFFFFCIGWRMAGQ